MSESTTNDALVRVRQRLLDLEPFVRDRLMHTIHVHMPTYGAQQLEGMSTSALMTLAEDAMEHPRSNNLWDYVPLSRAAAERQEEFARRRAEDVRRHEARQREREERQRADDAKREQIRLEREARPDARIVLTGHFDATK